MSDMTYEGPGVGIDDDDEITEDDRVVDDFDDEPTGGSAPLAELRSELSAEAAKKEATFDVLERPGYSVTFFTGFEHDLIQTFRKKARTKQFKSVDEIRLALLIVTHFCRAIRKNGQVIVGADGQPVTFSSAEFLDIMGALTPPAAARKLYGRDAHVIRASGQILEAAGYGDTDEEGADPTL